MYMTHNCLNGCIKLFKRMTMHDKTFYRVVAMVEKFHDILEHIHSMECGHCWIQTPLFYVYLYGWDAMYCN